MVVNFIKGVLRSRPIKLLTAIATAFSTVFVLAAFINDRSEDHLISKRVNIAIRAIGHDLLLRVGDSTSVIRPVIEKPNGVFLLEFENEFKFQPDTLVAISQRILDKTGLSRYSLTVYKCRRPEVVYGFEIDPPNNSIIACLGRNQPKACYNIEIAFTDFSQPAVSNIQIGLMLGGIPLVVGLLLLGRNLGLAGSKTSVQQKVPVENESEARITLSKFIFDGTNQCLMFGEEVILLTDKESKILTLLNSNIGQLTPREELIQDIWTDEGVITGRSLDVFISRLRKKLSADPDLRITNIHGKGYRLEIVNNVVG